MQTFKYETREVFYLSRDQFDFLKGGADWFSSRLSRFGVDGYSFIGERSEIEEAQIALQALAW